MPQKLPVRHRGSCHDGRARPGGTSDRLLDLERIIEQQQQMIKNQAEAFETLKLRIETVEGRTQANSEAVTKNQAAVTAATRSVRRIDSAATPPKMMTSGNPNVKLSVSGWVNKFVRYADNETHERVMVNDNVNSESRIRWKGNAKVDEKLSVGTNMELGYKQNNSNQASIINDSPSAGSFVTRHSALYIKHKDAGKITIGHTSPAADAINHINLSGIAHTLLPNGAALGAGALEFTNETTGVVIATVSSVMNDFDHQSRRNTLRYDTPTFAGFSLGTSFIDHAGGGWDIAARYSGKIGDFKIKAGLAHSNGEATTINGGRNTTSGQIAVKHSSGISAIFGASDIDLKDAAPGRNDPDGMYAQLAYGFNALSYGTTTIAIDWQSNDDLQQNDDEADAWRGTINQQIKKGAADVYLSFEYFDLDRPGTPTSNIFTVLVGSIVRF